MVELANGVKNQEQQEQLPYRVIECELKLLKIFACANVEFCSRHDV